MHRIAIVACFLIFFLPAFGQQNDSLNAVTLDLLEKQLKFKPDSCYAQIVTLKKNGSGLLPRINYLIGNYFLQKKHYDSASVYFTMAESGIGNDPKLLGLVYYGKGIGAYDKAEYKLALQFYKKADGLISEMMDAETKCMIVNELGNTQLALNQPDSALPCFETGLNLANRIGEKWMISRMLNNLSITYYKLGNFEKAIEWQLNAVSIKEQMADTLSLSISLNNVGSFFIKLDNYSDAKRFLLRAYHLLPKSKKSKTSGQTALNLGICYKMLDNQDSAIYYYQKALEIYTGLGLQSNISKIYSNLGGLYEAAKDYDKALEYMLLSLEIGKSLNLDYETAIRNRNVANVYLLTDKPDLAYNYLMDALKIATKLESLELQMEVYKTMADYYEKTGKYKQALQYFREYKNMADTLRSEGSLKHIHELNIIYETEKKEKNIINLLDQQRIRDLTIKQKEDALLQQKLILTSTILLAVLVLLSLYFVFVRYRLKERNKREILARQKSDLEQRMLLSQMNPHFIFNSLGAVQHYIGRNEPSNAQLFLSKFAKLMRSILENSRQQFITVEEEKEALSLYLELEQQRFPGRFNYTIDLQIEEPEFIMIPPMMVQPFIENAILHGFTNPEVEGELMVRYTMVNGLIRCIITDNGVGRSKSAMNKKAADKHVSLGSTVVAERIALLRKEFHRDAAIIYHDLESGDGKQHGTQVTIDLPYKEREG
jgi:tetratricopeptide (TPR) repeat protein